MAFFLQQDLRCNVLRRAAERVRRPVAGGEGSHVLLAQAEIRKLNVPISIQQNVLGLQITVHDVLLVQMVQRKYQLRGVQLHSLL